LTADDDTHRRSKQRYHQGIEKSDEHPHLKDENSPTPYINIEGEVKGEVMKPSERKGESHFEAEDRESKGLPDTPFNTYLLRLSPP
jgi:hypothetical protein